MTRTGFEIGISIYVNADGDLGLFENGLRQNVLFLYELFRKAPGCARVYLINGGDGEVNTSANMFGIERADVVRLAAVHDRLDCLIVMGATLDPREVRAARDRGCVVIGYKGGNGAVISMEAVVAKGAREDGERYFDADLFDEIWLTPQHWRTYRGWCELIYRCRVRQIPHIWSPMVVRASAGPSFGYRRGAGQWRVGVMDPNITVMKTSHVPMLVCEEAYRRNRHMFRAIYVTNGARFGGDPHFSSFALSLAVVQNGIMTFEGRYVGSLFIRDHCDAIVTHQWENALNYLYWEALYGNYPLIHNSPLLDGAGYYYDDFDAQVGGAALIDAHLRHDDGLREYEARAQAILAKLDPLSSANIAFHLSAVEEAFSSARPSPQHCDIG